MIGFTRQTVAQLFASTPLKVLSAASLSEEPVTGVAFDSRQVQPGNIFIALPGGNIDGHGYIPQALQAGAVAIVGSQALKDVPGYIQVAEPREALAYLSAAFYNFPGRHLTVIGVTGTDGKTTTSNLIFQILISAGVRAGVISTVSAVIGDEQIDTGFHVTTPEAPDVQRYLARMVNAGLTHVVLESTSHGLAQHRVTGCEFDIGVVTNITHEHLDYHGSYEAYREAKAYLFTGLSKTCPKARGNPRLAVLNRDDQSYDYLRGVTGVRQVGYSLLSGADLYAEDVVHQPDGMHFSVRGPDFSLAVKTHLVGDFNVSNILAALAATVLGLGIPLEAAQRGIADLRGVPGRMERVNLGQDFIAMVDFAHTPNALKVALQTARQMTDKRVIVVFGAAGLRDRAKRAMMAEVSTGLADISIFTAEDPRSESLDAILAEMAGAAQRKGGVEGRSYYRVPDRGEAISLGIQLAHSGDVVMACGKGHEQSMCFETTEYAWDDRTAMRAALARRLGLPGPKMPYLPTQEK
jgi:UDP-N-acetylmuramoyl-L-alanyl-D-glutamate--2,6-diaminopimelate ligase